MKLEVFINGIPQSDAGSLLKTSTASESGGLPVTSSVVLPVTSSTTLLSFSEVANTLLDEN